MLEKEAFINFILEGPGSARSNDSYGESPLPEGFEGFDLGDVQSEFEPDNRKQFAQMLLEELFGAIAANPSRDSVIRCNTSVSKFLPEMARYWDKKPTCPHFTLLFETDLTNKDLLSIPAFKNRKMAHLDIVEDALSRLVQEVLEGHQRRGEGVTSDVRQGPADQTLCVISIIDERDGSPSRLLCFGTVNQETKGLETFLVSEQVRSWEPHLAREHLGQLYERQFKKLSSSRWQEAFTTSEERKQASKLLELGSLIRPTEEAIQECVLGLLDTIAKGFGLRKKSKDDKLRLRADQLPPDHDIGMEPETRANEAGGKNPFRGVTLRDEKSRLLGYIVYPLNNTSDADRLRAYLEEHNRFHNVLVVYPDKDETRIELWQGTDQLQGKLRRGKQGYTGAAEVVNLLSRFFVVSKAKVSNPPELAKELAYRARYLRSIALEQLEQESDSGELRALHSAFKEALVHDQTEADFADAFAQTLTYSLLTARWVLSAQGGKTGDRFTRKAAMKKLAIGSRFLSEMFTAVLSMQLDKQNRLHWLVDDLTGLLDRVDVVSVFQDDGSDLTADPIIHFYEPFLQEYDAEIRMQRGVFYTPKPVVSYIVRSVDELLRTEFGLEDGLADTATWGDMVQRMDGLEIPEGASAEQGFVQILDPATGTGTFLVEVIDVIHATMVKKWTAQGHNEAKVLSLWNKYVPEQLLPRLYGYELMMAPYAVAHLKIGLKLHDTGYAFGSEVRTQVYLTNALEPAQDFTGTLEFAVPALAHEAQAVNAVKKERRFTVVIGNPPYSKASQNLGGQYDRLIQGFRFFRGERIREKGAILFERDINNDYAKFLGLLTEVLRMSSSGIAGVITSRSYLDGKNFRGVRDELQEVCSIISVTDLHGDSRTDNRAQCDVTDENVFDIQTGVAVGLFCRMGSHSIESAVQYSALTGSREYKYETLRAAALDFSSVLMDHRRFFSFLPSSSTVFDEYQQGMPINDLFCISVDGIKTSRDGLVLAKTKDECERKICAFMDHPGPAEVVASEFSISVKKWDWRSAQAHLKATYDRTRIKRIAYRPFDFRYIYHDPVLVFSDRSQGMQHMSTGSNIALVCASRLSSRGFDHILVTDCLAEMKYASHDTNSRLFPFWKFDNVLGALTSKAPNAIPGRAQIADAAWPRKLRCILAVMHSSIFRTRFFDEIKNDFPRVPTSFPRALSDKLSSLGGELIDAHLAINPCPQTMFLSEGSIKGVLETPKFKDGNLNLNKWFYFTGVSQEIFDFKIAGYQVAKTWISAGGRSGLQRKGMTLTTEVVTEYSKVLFGISEILRLRQQINDVIEAHGGWPGVFVTENEGDA